MPRLLVFLFIVLFFPAFAFSSAATVKEKSGEQYYSLPKLKTITPQEGLVYTTEGYVIMKYDCPPCPENAVCAPCPPDYIIISRGKKMIEYPDQMGPKDLMAISMTNIDFKLGKKYRFQLKLSRMPSWWDEKNNFEVVHATMIK